MQKTRGHIETLCRDLHAEILRVLHPSRDVEPMTWSEFQVRAGLERWDRHNHWKLREGELRWGPEKLIAVARRLGIPVVVAAGREADSLLQPPPAPAPPPPAPRRKRVNASDPRLFSLFGTDVPTLCGA